MIPIFLLLLVFALTGLILGVIQRFELHSVRRRLDLAEHRLWTLDRRLSELDAAPAAPSPAVTPVEAMAPVVATPVMASARVAAEPPPRLGPAPIAPPSIFSPTAEPAPAAVWSTAESVGTPEPAAEPAPFPTPAPAPARAAIDWEKFMGVRLLAWLGGLAFFLGVAYFVKYSFERNLIPPAARVAIGLFTGLGLVGGGLFLRRREYAVTSQTLSATGVVVLYAALFAGHALYHLAWLPQIATFFLMSIVTAAAFVIAARANALVVAILGMLGGFLTPVLLSEGGDQPVALFSYLALLDLGLLALALRCRWDFLGVLGAAATGLLELAWAARYFAPERAGLGLAIFAGFVALFTAGLIVARWRSRDSDWWAAAAAVSAAVVLIHAGGLLASSQYLARPGLIFAFVLAADLGLLAAAWNRHRFAPAHLAGGVLAFGYLTVWMARGLDASLLGWGIGLSLGLAGLHTAFPLVLAHYQPRAAKFAAAAAQVFPPLALLGLLVPLVHLETPSFALWPAILLLDGLALALAWFARGWFGAVASLLLGLAISSVWIGRLPVETAPLGGTLLVLLLSAALFAGVSGGIARRRRPDSNEAATAADFGRIGAGTLPVQLPILATLLPFISLAQIFAQLRPAEPSPVFATVAALLAMVFGLSAWLRLGLLPLAGLGGLALVEHAWWWSLRGQSDHPVLAVAWCVVFLAAFATVPFWPRARLGEMRLPWIAAALAALPQFHVVYRIVERTWTFPAMGLIPLLFAVPAGLTLAWLVRKGPASERGRLERLAWFGGVTLFFVTLALPIQLDRQWLTMGFALEGAALLALFRRVPHPGLRLVGVGLLATVFLRLVVNPFVFEYAVRGPYPIWNWWLYSYGLATVALFTGARLLRPGEDLVSTLPARPFLTTLGTITLFALVNLQIADFFTAPGETVRFEFSSSLGSDMSYTIAWAVFALGLVVAGLARQLPSARWAGLGLLAVATVKLFLNDLARLDQLYRVGALIGVALAALAASVFYQRFVAREGTHPEHAPHHP